MYLCSLLETNINRIVSYIAVVYPVLQVEILNTSPAKAGFFYCLENDICSQLTTRNDAKRTRRTSVGTFLASFFHSVNTLHHLHSFVVVWSFWSLTGLYKTMLHSVIRLYSIVYPMYYRSAVAVLVLRESVKRLDLT